MFEKFMNLIERIAVALEKIADGNIDLTFGGVVVDEALEKVTGAPDDSPGADTPDPEFPQVPGNEPMDPPEHGPGVSSPEPTGDQACPYWNMAFNPDGSAKKTGCKDLKALLDKRGIPYGKMTRSQGCIKLLREADVVAGGQEPLTSQEQVANDFEKAFPEGSGPQVVDGVPPGTPVVGTAQTQPTAPPVQEPGDADALMQNCRTLMTDIRDRMGPDHGTPMLQQLLASPHIEVNSLSQLTGNCQKLALLEQACHNKIVGLESNPLG